MEHSLWVGDQLSQVAMAGGLLALLFFGVGFFRSDFGKNPMEQWCSLAYLVTSLVTASVVAGFGSTIEVPIPMPQSAALGMTLWSVFALQSGLAIAWIFNERKQGRRRRGLSALFFLVPASQLGMLAWPFVVGGVS